MRLAARDQGHQPARHPRAGQFLDKNSFSSQGRGKSVCERWKCRAFRTPMVVKSAVQAASWRLATMGFSRAFMDNMVVAGALDISMLAGRLR
jgi:hypothetical protein